MRKFQLKSFFGGRDFYKQVAGIALPVVAQQFVTSFVNLIDNIMVGGVGQTALTSVTVANRFYMIASGFLFGLTGAAGIFIAQNYGAEKKEQCQKIFNLNMILSVLVMAIFTGILFAVPTQILNLFSRTPEIVNLGLDYISVAKYTYIPYGISLTCIMAMRSIGINKVQLKVGTLTVLTNSVLNYILIYGKLGAPAMGVEGAALATVIARLLEMSIYITLLVRQKYFYRLDLKGFLRIDVSLLTEIMKKAVPLTINELLYSVGMSILLKSYMRADEMLVAAISVVDTVMNLAYIVFGGLSSAIAIFIGGKLGAGHLEEAKAEAKKIMMFAVMVSVVLSSILFIAAPYIHHLYSLDEEAIAALQTMIRFKSMIMPIYAISVSVFYILRAGGDTLSTLIVDSGYLWFGPVALSTILTVFTSIGLVQLFLIVELLELVKMSLSIWLFKKGRWVRNLAADQPA